MSSWRPITCPCALTSSECRDERRKVTTSAEDLAQETLQEVCRLRPSYGIVESASAWRLVLGITEAQRFWRRPRMRTCPHFRWNPWSAMTAVVAGFEAVDGGDRLEMAPDASAYAVLSIESHTSF